MVERKKPIAEEFFGAWHELLVENCHAYKEKNSDDRRLRLKLTGDFTPDMICSLNAGFGDMVFNHQPADWYQVKTTTLPDSPITIEFHDGKQLNSGMLHHITVTNKDGRMIFTLNMSVLVGKVSVTFNECVGATIMLCFHQPQQKLW